jgi:hypothetical protein
LNDSKLDLYFSTNNAIHYLGEALEGGVCMWGRVLLFKMASSGTKIVIEFAKYFTMPVLDSDGDLQLPSSYFCCPKGNWASSHNPQTDSQRTSSWVPTFHLPRPVAYLGIFFGGGGGGGGNKFSCGPREWGSGGGSPLLRGSGGSCNLVQESSFRIVKFS